MRLNIIQKMVLASFGIGIFFVQMMKFAEDGIQGVSWVFALLVSVLLVLPVIGETNRQRRSSTIVTTAAATVDQVTVPPSPHIQEFVSFHKAQSSILPLLKAIEQNSNVLHSEIDQWLGFDPAFRMSGVYMYEHVHQYCLAYCYGLTLLVEAKADINFVGSERQKILMARVAKLVVECNRSILKKIGAEDKFDESKQRSFAMKDMIDVEKAITGFIGSLASGESKPDTELIRFLVDRLSIPKEKLPTFAPSLQDFTKLLILEQAQAKKSSD